jgi:hypothetical protein
MFKSEMDAMPSPFSLAQQRLTMETKACGLPQSNKDINVLLV